MRVLLALLASVSLLPALARAADKPLVAPPAAWVRPSEIPALPDKADAAPVRVLLSDQQISFDRGRTTVYSRTVLKITTAQGLAAGNISFDWRPDADTPTVHKIVIHRGDKLIDVLASGQTFTVMRRETNLDAASLDGVLTANIQPEDLQVGDELDFSMSITSQDPVLKDHVESFGAAWNLAPISNAHLRTQWPLAMPLRLRTSGALPKLQMSKASGIISAELSLKDIQPVAAPRGAPARYGVGRLVEASDFASWADLAAVLAPLYDTASKLPDTGALHDELVRIEAASTDPKGRAEAALALVQDKIRYVALAMGEGGLMPTAAQTTWERRYGDCKAKTALLLALLHALNIDAQAVIVNASGGDGFDERLPMVGLFNHVLVAASIGGRKYWLDGTRNGDRSLDLLRTPYFGWGLPLTSHGASLVRMVPPPLDRPDEETNIRIDAVAGLTVPAPTTITQIFRGDRAVGLDMAISSLVGEARDRSLRDYWRAQYNFVDVKDVAVTTDKITSTTTLTMHGMANMDWQTGDYETDGTDVGYKADFHRDPGPDADAPFAVDFPFFSKNTEVIVLPPGFKDTKLGTSHDAGVDQTVAGIHYQRTAAIKGGIFTVIRSARSLTPEFPANDAAAAQATLRDLSDQAVFLHRPATYTRTPAELAKLMSLTPSTAAGFVDRGNVLLYQGKFDQAFGDYTKALVIDAKSSDALAARGVSLVWKKDYDSATRDLDAAFALAPENPVIFRGRGLMAEQQSRYKDALSNYERAGELEPGDEFSFQHRVSIYKVMGNAAEALSLVNREVAQHPDHVDLYLARANLLQSQGKTNEAVAQAALVATANPTDDYALVVAGRIYSSFGKDAEAQDAFDRALAIKPQAYIYIDRANSRPKRDIAGRATDIDAAIKLDPMLNDAIAAKAALQEDTGDLKGALSTYNTAIAASPASFSLVNKRGIVHARLREVLLSEQDFAAARRAATSGAAFNALCWDKAVAGVALASALVDCEAALAKEPANSAFLDSRGLLLLRLGRWNDAIATYSAALKITPDLSYSRYGRAIAYSRTGDTQRAQADREAAVAANSGITERFREMGFK